MISTFARRMQDDVFYLTSVAINKNCDVKAKSEFNHLYNYAYILHSIIIADIVEVSKNDN